MARAWSPCSASSRCPLAAEQDAVVEQVLLADRLGLDLVGIQDHPYQRRHLDAWTLISYLAGRTERVRFFPDVANLPLRHPARARQVGGDARPADRRAGRARARRRRVLGGRSARGAGRCGRARSRSTRSVEAIAIIRRVWAAERGIDVEGEHYRMKGAHGGPGAGARHRDLARRLRAADDARRRAAGRRLGPEPAAAAARGGAGAAGRDRRGGARRRAATRRQIRRVANLNGVIARRATAGCAARPSTGSRSSSSSRATCASTASSRGSTTRTSSGRPSASRPRSRPPVREALAERVGQCACPTPSTSASPA